jgi:hypothetical protein
MSRTIWFKSFDSGQLANNQVFQPLRYNNNKIIRYCRAVLIFVGAPNFENLRMNVYANDENKQNPTPTQLIHISTNSWSLAELMTLDHGWKDVYFKFNDFHMRGGVYYNFVLSATGYSPTSSSYLGVELEYPNPIHRENYTPTYVNFATSPYKIYTIGADL